MRLKPAKAKKGKGEEATSRLAAKVSNKDVAFLSALAPFSHRDYACLVPFALEEGRSRTQVVYDTTSLVALSSYLEMPVDSDQFVVMIESLLRSLEEIAQLGVRMDYLQFDLDHVYINTVRGSVAFLMGGGVRKKRQEQDPTFEVFRALGAQPKPMSFDDREFMGEYVAGLDAIMAQGLSAYRLYAQSFVDRFRGVVPQANDSVKAPSQRFSREIFYDAQHAADQAERENRLSGDGVHSTAPGRMPAVKLTSVSTGTSWGIPGYPYVLGSGVKADCRIQGSEWVSRMHARLFCEGRRVIVEDLESTNGTSVNGTRLQRGGRRMLSDGDEVDLAGERFKVSIRSR